MRLSRHLIAALLVVLACASYGETPSSDFDAPLSGWTVSVGEILAEPLGNKYLHLASRPGSEEMPRLSMTQSLTVREGEEIRVEFRYRTNIESSGMHRGAWVYLPFADAGGKGIKGESDGLVLPQSGAWSQFVGKMAVPAGATQVQAQIRVQSSPGRFLDIDDLKLSCAPTPPVASINPLHDPERVAVASFVLQPDRTLKGSDGQTLANLSGGGVLSFQLPDQYCERPEYSYGVQATFRTDWAKDDTSLFHTIFSLGSVFSGQDANSAEIAFIGRDHVRFRVRCDKNSEGMEWGFPLDVPGKAAQVAALFGNHDLQASVGGPWKWVGSVQPFIWEKNRRFSLGSTGGNANLLAGEILSFSLTVFKPGVRAEMAGGAEAGLFHGPGAHRWGIAFPEGGGPRAKLDFTVTDSLGKQYPTPATDQASANAVNFTMPKLPYGWYELKARIELDGHVRTLARAFAVTPELDPSTAADESPLGITQGFALDKRTFSAQYVEQLFRASAAAGNRWFRLWTEWSNFEQEPGKRDWSVMDQVVELAQQYHLELYVNLAGGNLPWQCSLEPGTPRVTTYLSQYMPRDLEQWSAFVTEFASRYRGRISYFQVGNESDTKEFFQPFSPESYLKMLKAGYLAVKQGNPEAKVGLPGFTAVYSQMDKAKMEPGDRTFGAKAFWDLKPEPYYDLLDFHFYSLGTPNFYWDPYTQLVPRLWDFLKQRGEGGKPMWNSETGFQSGVKGERGGYDPSPMISDYEQACRLVEWHVQSQSVNIARSFNYLVTGTSGLFQGDFSPKVSYAASVNLARMLPGMQFEREVPLPSGMAGYSFVGKKTGTHLVVVWCRAGGFPMAVSAAAGALVTRVDLFGNAVKLPVVGGLSLITVDESPSYFVSSQPFNIDALIAVTPRLSTEPGQAKLHVTMANPTLSSMKATIGASFPGTAPAREELTLAPRERRGVTLTLQQGEGSPTVEVMITGATTASFSMAVPYAPRKLVALPSGGQVEVRIDQPEQVRVGGETLDSQNRVLTAAKWHGPADASAVAHLSRDGNKIRFEIQVTDDQVVTVPARAPHDQDCVELFYALLDDADQVTERGQIMLRADGQVFPAGRAVLPDLQVKSERNAAGYLLAGSFTLPQAALNRHCMLFDLSLDDADAGDPGRRTQIVWSGTEYNYQAADGYGVLALP